MKTALLALALALTTAVARQVDHGDLTCNYPEDPRGWLHCTDNSDGSLWDCMPIGTGDYCIRHQVWHDET